MKFLDFFVNQSFKKDKDGNDLFFPWGVLGKGHMVDSLETKQKIQRFLRLYYLITYSILLLWIIAINPYFIIQVSRQTANGYLPTSDFTGNLLWAELPSFLIFSLGAFIGWYIGIQPFVKRLPTTTAKLGWGEAYKKNAKALHPAFLWFGQISTILFVLVVLFLLLQDAMPVWIGLISIIPFGLAALGYAYMIYLRNKP
ncbi:MAG: hypothetical protein WA821_11010 [Anaerolineales bacterium]